MSKFIIFTGLLVALYFFGKRALTARPGMDRRAAARVLGLTYNASPDAVAEAHRRLIARVHPDAGGSAELASQINQARDVMLRP